MRPVHEREPSDKRSAHVMKHLNTMFRTRAMIWRTCKIMRGPTAHPQGMNRLCVTPGLDSSTRNLARKRASLHPQPNLSTRFHEDTVYCIWYCFTARAHCSCHSSERRERTGGHETKRLQAEAAGSRGPGLQRRVWVILYLCSRFPNAIR